MLLRYPGSKFKAGPDLLSLAPLRWREWREPFCGTACMLWHVPRDVDRWINDIDPAVIRFHLALRDETDFVDRLMELRRYDSATAIRDAFCEARWTWHKTGCPVAYWLLNQYAYGQFVRRKRKNFASFSYRYIRHGEFRLKRKTAVRAREIMQGVKITQGDYTALLNEPGKDVFLFIDPPYYCDAVLYDYQMSLEDHELFRDRLVSCGHPFLTTLGNGELTQRLYVKESSLEVDYRLYRYTNVLATQAGPLRDEMVVRNYRHLNS